MCMAFPHVALQADNVTKVEVTFHVVTGNELGSWLTYIF